MWAIIENNKVVNIVVDIDVEDLKNNPDRYIDYTDGWDYSNGIDGGDFFPHEAATESSGSYLPITEQPIIEESVTEADPTI